MNWTRAQLKSNAKLMVKKNWVLCAVVSFILVMVGGGVGGRVTITWNNPQEWDFREAANNLMTSMGGEWVFWIRRFLPFIAGATVFVLVLAFALEVFVGNPLNVGGSRFFLHNIHSDGQFEDLGFAFSNQYNNVVKVMLVRMISVLLWSLLLVIPGVIKSYEYRMVPYLLADNPELSSRDALNLSREMMYGEKWNAFVLDLSFILWEMLSGLTFGIAGYIWVNPYRFATNAELYMALSAKRSGGQWG